MLPSRISSSRPRAWLARLWLLVLALTGVPAQASDAQTRLALLVNFVKFVEWPNNHDPKARQQWQLCFVDPGDDVAVEAQKLQGALIYDVPVEVRILQPGGDVNGCHLLYLPDSLNRKEMQTTLQQVDREPVLTVSDRPGFARRNGMVEIVVESGRYQFDVGYGKVLSADLSLASGMLKLARRVH